MVLARPAVCCCAVHFPLARVWLTFFSKCPPNHRLVQLYRRELGWFREKCILPYVRARPLLLSFKADLEDAETEADRKVPQREVKGDASNVCQACRKLLSGQNSSVLRCGLCGNSACWACISKHLSPTEASNFRHTPSSSMKDCWFCASCYAYVFLTKASECLFSIRKRFSDVRLFNKAPVDNDVYNLTIDKPMDFVTISNRLHKLEYPTLRALYNDFILICNNARLSATESQTVLKRSSELKTMVQREFQKLESIPQPDSWEWSHDLNPHVRSRARTHSRNYVETSSPRMSVSQTTKLKKVASNDSSAALQQQLDKLTEENKALMKKMDRYDQKLKTAKAVKRERDGLELQIEPLNKRIKQLESNLHSQKAEIAQHPEVIRRDFEIRELKLERVKLQREVKLLLAKCKEHWQALSVYRKHIGEDHTRLRTAFARATDEISLLKSQQSLQCAELTHRLNICSLEKQRYREQVESLERKLLNYMDNEYRAFASSDHIGSFGQLLQHQYKRHDRDENASTSQSDSTKQQTLSSA